MWASSATSCTCRSSTPSTSTSCCGKRAAPSASPMPATAPSTRCGSRKRYLYWGADITPDYTPYEAGLGFAVALKKGDFIGREALAKAKSEGPRRRLCCFLLDEPAAVYGGEAIWLGPTLLGVTTSGGYGHTIGEKHRLRLRPGRARRPRDLRDRDLRPPRAGAAIAKGAVRSRAAQDSRVKPRD